MSDLEVIKTQVISCEIKLRSILDKYINSDNEKDRILDLIADIEELSGKFTRELIKLENYIERHKGEYAIKGSEKLLKEMKGER